MRSDANTERGGEKSALLCDARDCPRPPLTGYQDGAGESWWLCEEHGDMLAVGFPTRRHRLRPLRYDLGLTDLYELEAET